MVEPDAHFGPVEKKKKEKKRRSWYGDREQTAMETEAESKGRELTGRMSETLVPEAWAGAFSCWCQNVFLRACGQTKIKGNQAAEWHHTHTHVSARTRVSGLSQFGFIMSQLFNVSNPHNAV